MLGLNALMLKKHTSFLILSSSAALCPPTVRAPVPLRPRLPNTQSPLIGQLTHTNN